MAGAPTDHLANERTFLAWVRTAITVIGLGFVVARFGLFLRALATGTPGPPSLVSQVIGVFLVLAGSLLVVIAWYHFHRVQESLKAGTFTPHGRLELLLAGALVAVGVGLAAYLLATG